MRKRSMDHMRHVVTRATWRLGLDTATRLLGRLAIGLGGFVCLVIAIDRLVFLGPPAGWAMLAGVAVTLALAAGLAVRRWPNRLAAAVAIDDRLRLGERISSAVAVERSSEPMARAVVADAHAYARMVPVSRAFPLRMHREYWVVLGLMALSLGLFTWMPRLDLLSRRERMAARRKEREAVQREARRIERELVQLRKSGLVKGESIAAAHIEEMEDVVREMKQGNLMRAEAMAKLSDLGEALRKAGEGLARKALVPPAVTRKQGLDLTRDLAKALENKDFAAAAAELRKLAEQAASDDTPQEQKDKLARELDALADALEGSKDLADALRRLANDLPECDGDQLAKRLGELDRQLDQQGDLEAELEALKQAARMCKGCKGALGKKGEALAGQRLAGIYTEGDQRRRGPGMGGPGIGRGGEAPILPENVTFATAKPPSQVQPGRVVGSYFADGKQLKGEAKVEYGKDVSAATAEAARALKQEKIPRAYRDLVRDYFHGMKTE